MARKSNTYSGGRVRELLNEMFGLGRKSLFAVAYTFCNCNISRWLFWRSGAIMGLDNGGVSSSEIPSKNDCKPALLTIL